MILKTLNFSSDYTFYGRGSLIMPLLKIYSIKQLDLSCYCCYLLDMPPFPSFFSILLNYWICLLWFPPTKYPLVLLFVLPPAFTYIPIPVPLPDLVAVLSCVGDPYPFFVIKPAPPFEDELELDLSTIWCARNYYYYPAPLASWCSILK